MDGTTVLAFWGAVTGTASVGVQTATHFRDRVKLSVTAKFKQTEDEDLLIIEVSNRGRQPTTITEAGLLVKSEVTYEVEERKIINTAPFSIRWDDGSPVLLKPGEVHQYSRNLAGWPEPMLHAESPLRPYVSDSHGRQCWGEPGPFLRMMMNMGWQPRGVVDSRLVEPLEEPMLAEPVTSKWKVWRPRHEREPWASDPDMSQVKVRLNVQMED